MKRSFLFAATFVGFANLAAAQTPSVPPPAATPVVVDNRAFILTPPPPSTPRINGPRIIGARPDRPFLYQIPATGDRPIRFSAESLPKGLKLDAKTGRITGRTPKEPGRQLVMLTATNAQGTNTNRLTLVIGSQIALTPPLGWNSWNCFAGAVNQKIVEAQADALVKSGLADHGWTYINIDDTWQGARGGKYKGLQGNDKFPDMKGLCDHIHQLGLKAGIYSTPWVTSYARYAGGSAETPDGKWEKPGPGDHPRNKKLLPFAVGKVSFAVNDANQWADWGFDYLKYDWNPIETPQVEEMQNALRLSGRDVVLSLSNSAPFAGAADWARLSNAWRTSGDIRDTWQSMTRNGFGQAKWEPFNGPGHWNDPDMLVVGNVGWGPKLHPTHLTPDEQYTHISLWALLSAPLLIGCDLTTLDDFTKSLLTNDEVLAIDQDELGKSATRLKQEGTSEVWVKPLVDGRKAVGLFNRGEAPATLSVTWAEIGGSPNAPPAHIVRDVWRQKTVPSSQTGYETTVAPHGVVLVVIGETPNPSQAAP